MSGAVITTIEKVEVSTKYSYVRTIHLKDLLYKVVLVSNQIYEVGDKVLYIPDRAKLPVRLLKAFGFWDYRGNHGLLSGVNYNVVRPYCFNDDYDYYSCGIIILLSKVLEAGITLREDQRTLDSQLGITYLEKKNPYIFRGDEYFLDLNINKNIAVELERCYKLFENTDVVCEEYIRGRQFYITFDKKKMFELAHGMYARIHITGQNYAKCRFLSNTKRNMEGNLFCIVTHKNDFTNKAVAILRMYPNMDRITFNVVVRTQAFGAKFTEQLKHSEYVVTDIYIGNSNTGYFFPLERRNYLCSYYGMPAPKMIYSGPYNYDVLHGLANIGNTAKHVACTGIIIRNQTDTRAVLYSEDARLRYSYCVKN